VVELTAAAAELKAPRYFEYVITLLDTIVFVIEPQLIVRVITFDNIFVTRVTVIVACGSDLRAYGDDAAAWQISCDVVSSHKFVRGPADWTAVDWTAVGCGMMVRSYFRLYVSLRR
jgi:hypothetical protein